MKAALKIQRIAFIAILFIATACRAEDAFYVLPVREVQLREGTLLPAPATQPDYVDWEARGRMRPYAIIDGGEAFFLGEDQGANMNGSAGPLRICVGCANSVYGSCITEGRMR